MEFRSIPSNQHQGSNPAAEPSVMVAHFFPGFSGQTLSAQVLSHCTDTFKVSFTRACCNSSITLHAWQVGSRLANMMPHVTSLQAVPSLSVSAPSVSGFIQPFRTRPSRRILASDTAQDESVQYIASSPPTQAYQIKEIRAVSILFYNLTNHSVNST